MDENDEIDSEKMSKRKRNNQRVQMKYRCYHYCGCCSLTISFKMLELRIVDCPSIFSKKITSIRRNVLSFVFAVEGMIHGTVCQLYLNESDHRRIS